LIQKSFTIAHLHFLERPSTRNHMEKTASKGARLSSVSAAARVLKCFSEVEPELGISNLAKRLSLAKSTIHRLATTLTLEGLLDQNPESGRYRLGINLFVMGTLVRRRLDVSNVSQPFLHMLRERTGETIHLAVLNDASIMYLFNLEGSQAIRMRSYIGTLKPAFCTCEGRAIAAFGSNELVTRVLSAPLTARTPGTLTDSAKVLKALAVVRATGYAIDDEESEAGMRGIGAPIRDSSGQVVAAVGIGGPSQRLTVKKLRSLAPVLLSTAEAISTQLGYRA
jgi:IclR family transcriptional regulator, KDG regulon repressor